MVYLLLIKAIDNYQKTTYKVDRIPAMATEPAMKDGVTRNMPLSMTIPFVLCTLAGSVSETTTIISTSMQNTLDDKFEI